MTNLKPIAQALQSKGRYGDTILAHINPQEAELLKLLGGSGTTNPDTGLPEYWGGFGSIFHAVTQYIAPVAIIVTAIVAPEILPALGSSIASTLGIGAVSATTAAAIGAGAVGAGSAALNTAVAGGNGEQILKAAAISGAASAAGATVGGAVAGEVTGATGGPVAVASDVGPTLGSNVPGAISGGAAGGATQAFTKSQLAGSNLDTSLKNAEIGGATGAITSAIGQGVQTAGGSPQDIQLASALSGPFVSQNVSNLFNPTPSSTGGGTSGQPTSSLLTTGQPGTTPGSQALAQSLNLGGGDISPPVNIGGGEKNTPNVWNQASLRTKDETGSA